ncbi:hypothetical protein TNCV_3526471 [Trichonephila clavipes]|nr:hypothetical protein TNCV_3526471 [Trichonephila clavipes]
MVTHRAEALMHVKSFEALCPSLGVVWKFGKGSASSQRSGCGASRLAAIKIRFAKLLSEAFGVLEEDLKSRNIQLFWVRPLQCSYIGSQANQ